MTSAPNHRAAFSAALAPISGQRGEPSPADFDQAVEKLRELADVVPPAKAKLAAFLKMGIGNSQNRKEANKLFLEAAMTGFPPSVRDLGVIVIASGQDGRIGAGLLCRAASAGDWIAGFLILREACRGRYYLNTQNLKGLAGQLSDAVPFKEEILHQINSLQDDFAVLDKTGFNLATCQSALNFQQSSVSSFADLNSELPVVKSSHSVLSPLECDYLIAISCASMQSSKVVSSEAGDSIEAGFRTSDGTVLLPHMMDFPAVRMVETLSEVSGVDPRNGEFLSLLRYTPGQEYLPHHDYLDEDQNDYSMVKKCGQRCATLLTYLNDGYEDGETAFPNLDVTFKGEVGDSLYFQNTDQQAKPIPNSLHAGLPVTSGEKWLATLWIREKPFWPWAR